MSLRPVAARYAQALLESLAPADIDGVDADLSNLLLALHQNEATRGALLSPVVPVPAKRKAMAAVVPAGFHPKAARFIDYLFSKDRASILLEVLTEWNAQLRERRGEIEVKLVTASALGEGFAAKIKSYLEKKTGKTCRILPVEEKGLLGGFQVFYQNKVIDSSLKGRLRHLKENLTA